MDLNSDFIVTREKIPWAWKKCQISLYKIPNNSLYFIVLCLFIIFPPSFCAQKCVPLFYVTLNSWNCSACSTINSKRQNAFQFVHIFHFSFARILIFLHAQLCIYLSHNFYIVPHRHKNNNLLGTFSTCAFIQWIKESTTTTTKSDLKEE